MKRKIPRCGAAGDYPAVAFAGSCSVPGSGSV
jgi:hypothetical protein